jgi:hypothetical protein
VREVARCPVLRQLEDRDRRRDNVRRSTGRSKAQIIALARANDLRGMHTLTTGGGGVQGYAEFVALVRGWIMHHRHLLSDQGAYLVVGELHPDGHGWHAHILTDDRTRISLDRIKEIRQSWTRYLTKKGYGPTGGAKELRTHFKVWPTAEQAASYAASYVVKSLDREEIPKGSQRYIRGSGIKDPETEAEYFDAWELAIAAAEEEGTEVYAHDRTESRPYDLRVYVKFDKHTGHVIRSSSDDY